MSTHTVVETMNSAVHCLSPLKFELHSERGRGYCVKMNAFERRNLFGADTWLDVDDGFSQIAPRSYDFECYSL